MTTLIYEILMVSNFNGVRYLFFITTLIYENLMVSGTFFDVMINIQ